MREVILERDWIDDTGAYAGAFGSHHLDASVLLMPILDFVPADDERMRATIDAIERDGRRPSRRSLRDSLRSALSGSSLTAPGPLR